MKRVRKPFSLKPFAGSVPQKSAPKVFVGLSRKSRLSRLAAKNATSL